MKEEEREARDGIRDGHMYVKILSLDAILNATNDLQNSFWSNVCKTSPNECWEWQAKLSHGYVKGSSWRQEIST